MKFMLHAKVELTEREDKIMKKYNADMEPLFKGTGVFLGRTIEYEILARNLIRGRTWNCEDVLTIMNVEEKVRTACDNLKLILELMDSFGGEEVIEISTEIINGET